MDSLKPRSGEFNSALFKPAQVRDSRFGIRRFFLNKQEHPRVASYMNPGKDMHTAGM